MEILIAITIASTLGLIANLYRILIGKQIIKISEKKEALDNPI